MSDNISSIFCDFGVDFSVVDTNGEAPLSVIIASIGNDKDGVVTCLDETRHGLEDGDHVTFAEVGGMTELNGCAPRPVKVLGMQVVDKFRMHLPDISLKICSRSIHVQHRRHIWILCIYPRRNRDASQDAQAYHLCKAMCGIDYD